MSGLKTVVLSRVLRVIVQALRFYGPKRPQFHPSSTHSALWWRKVVRYCTLHLLSKKKTEALRNANWQEPQRKAQKTFSLGIREAQQFELKICGCFSGGKCFSFQISVVRTVLNRRSATTPNLNSSALCVAVSPCHRRRPASALLPSQKRPLPVPQRQHKSCSRTLNIHRRYSSPPAKKALQLQQKKYPTAVTHHLLAAGWSDRLQANALKKRRLPTSPNQPSSAKNGGPRPTPLSLARPRRPGHAHRLGDCPVGGVRAPARRNNVLRVELDAAPRCCGAGPRRRRRPPRRRHIAPGGRGGAGGAPRLRCRRP